jgi:serine/threonine protein kinase
MDSGSSGETTQIFQGTIHPPAAEPPPSVQPVSGDCQAEAKPGGRTAEAPAMDANIGRRIGPYEIVREIGAGGVGSVYLAQRVDEFRQRVAIKLLRAGMDSRMVISRFRHERQILAGLHHPNISRLLDGGATEDGRPYFVMEYVEGKPIDAYANERGLSIRERLQLFRQICAAVQYAHQNLVVHRDIKPGNILVTEDGTPKLLDFGIAKLQRPVPGHDAAAQEPSVAAAGGATLALTEADMRLMTPEFASPEQARGLPITTASDVYSLGVVLYQLLTGRMPYQFKTRSPVEVELVISEQEPPRPSTVGGILAKGLTGDLDNLVLKALEKDTQRRYGSAEQLSEDIRRYLEGMPVLARPQTLFYRAGKFARRNRMAVAAAILLFVSLTGGLVATSWEAQVARQQRARAERRFNDVRRLTESFLFEFHDKIKDLTGATEARRLVVAKALEYLDGLEREASGDRSLQLELAEAYGRLGDVQGNPYSSNIGEIHSALHGGKVQSTRMREYSINSIRPDLI